MGHKFMPPPPQKNKTEMNVRIINENVRYEENNYKERKQESAGN